MPRICRIWSSLLQISASPGGGRGNRSCEATGILDIFRDRIGPYTGQWRLCHRCATARFFMIQSLSDENWKLT